MLSVAPQRKQSRGDKSGDLGGRHIYDRTAAPNPIIFNFPVQGITYAPRVMIYRHILLKNLRKYVQGQR